MSDRMAAVSIASAIVIAMHVADLSLFSAILLGVYAIAIMVIYGGPWLKTKTGEE